MTFARFDELNKNEHIELNDGEVVLLSGYSESDKELFDSFVKAVNEYGYGIKSRIERENTK